VEDLPVTVLLIALLALLVLVAFSSGTEVAMLSANRYRIRSRADKGERTARLLDRLLAKPDDWLGANLIVLTLASAGATTIATIIAVRTDNEWAILFPTLVVPLVMLVICELAPKIYSALHADSVALFSAWPYQVLVWITRPGVLLANWAAYGFLRMFGVVKGVRDAGNALSSDELRTVVTEAGPMIPQRHRQMLLSILDLERLTVTDIMIPRQEIAGIDIDDDWEDILEQLRQTPHTRLPVYKGDIDDMIGLLHMKRVAQSLARGTLEREDLEELARTREPYFVPDSTTLMAQLGAFQRNRRRFAFVVDEYGDIQGLVTLEDILEEIVGEFTTDPATVTHKDVHRQPNGDWVINGSATVRALNRALGWQLPTDGPKTLNGVLLEQLETIPEPGVVLRVGNLQCEVMQVADKTIRAVRIKQLGGAAPQGRLS
jgi:Mg2+/Co2+ transporter CorB